MDLSSKELEIAKEREQIKAKMVEKLKGLNFDEKEIKSVLHIIFLAEGKIEGLKRSLIGTNINTDDPTPIMSKVISEIKETQIQMAKDIQEKIAQIEKRKNK